MSSFKLIGTDLVIMAYSRHDSDIHVTGTDRGQQFVDKRSDVLSSFVSFVSGEFNMNFI